MSYLKSFTAGLIRSPLLWGGAMAFCFFALIHGGVIRHAGTIRYLAGHWVEYVETVMFTVGLSALALKWLQAKLVEVDADGYLPHRMHEALDLVVRTGSAEGLEDHLKYLSDLDAARAGQSYGLVRFVIWAIPIMGFLGTVIGITEAIANLSPTQLENITGVVAGLGVAFDTTATALTLSMVLMLIQFFVDRAEQRLLGAVDSAAWIGLAGRFQSVAADDGTAVALAKLSEAVSRSSEKLLQAQEHSWRALEEAASGSLSRAVAASGQELRTALSDSLGRKTIYGLFFLLGMLLYAAVPAVGRTGSVPLFCGVFCLILTMYGGGFAAIPAYLADLFGPRFVGAIHGRLLTAWSVAGVLGPVLVNYVNEQQVRAGVPRSAAYDRTMILLAGLLAIGFVCNLLVRPVEMVSTEAVGPAAASSSPPASQATATKTRYAERGIGLLVSLWLLVAVPLAWGLWTTLQQAWALFG